MSMPVTRSMSFTLYIPFPVFNVMHIVIVIIGKIQNPSHFTTVLHVAPPPPFVMRVSSFVSFYFELIFYCIVVYLSITMLNDLFIVHVIIETRLLLVE